MTSNRKLEGMKYFQLTDESPRTLRRGTRAKGHVAQLFLVGHNRPTHTLSAEALSPSHMLSSVMTFIQRLVNCSTRKAFLI